MSDIRIQDDLYNHVNKDWIDQAVIPEDKPTIGGFASIDEEVESFEPERWDEEPDEMPDSETKKNKEKRKLEELQEKYEEKFWKKAAPGWRNNVERLLKKLAE